MEESDIYEFEMPSTLIESPLTQDCPKEPLIFLDIDGVLNRHDFNKTACSNLIERDLVQILNYIIFYTNAYIVLSSVWRYLVHSNEMTVSGMDWLLRSHGLAAGEHPKRRVIGVTDKDLPLENERGTQIQKWLDSNRVTQPYVVIDDGAFSPDNKEWSDLGIIAAGHPVVWTHSKVGLTYKDADRARKILINDPRAERHRPSPHMGSISPLRLLSGDSK